MKAKQRAALIVLVLLNLMLAAQGASDWVQVSGTVFDSSGQPLANAEISVFPMDMAVSGPLPGAQTDANGRYLLRTPRFQGRTRLCAYKDSAGYPNTQYLLYESPSEHMLELHLQAGSNLHKMDIHLGEPDGVLKLNILDMQTGNPVIRAQVVMHRTDEKPAISSNTVPPSGEYIAALPEAPIQIKVSAPGYRDWTYSDDSGQALVLRARQNKTITVKLTRVDTLH